MKRGVPFCLILIAVTAGCQTKRPSDAGSPPLADRREFASEAHGVRLSYPGEWWPVACDDYVLKLVHQGLEQSISLDVPKLPPHVPGFIPLGMVVNGYVDDVKKKHPGVSISQPEAKKVSGANARRVTSRWKDADGQEHSEHAVLTVHDDRVYIFRANAPAAGIARVRQALDVILATVTWQ